MEPKWQPLLEGYADASWGDDPVSMKSTSGYIMTVAGVTVDWCVTKQQYTALFSSEAKIVSVSQLCTDLKYVTTVEGSRNTQ